MLKYLIKTTTEIRIETKEDAEILHKEIEEFCRNNGYTLSSWTQNYKCRKQKGEIVDEFYQIKYIIQFNDIKEPETTLKDIQYNMGGLYE